MTAIVSSNFRVLNAENFREDVQESSVYVSVGKSDAWSNTISDTTDTTPFNPLDTLDALGEARQNMLGLKKISSAEVSHIVPRHNWTSGRSYLAWDSNDPDIFDKQFYIITTEFKVYKCIIAGTGGSIIQPTQTLTAPTAESDGYTWKYMYTVSVADSEKFLTNSYMPVKTVSLGASAIVAAGVSSSTEVVLTESNVNILTGMEVSGSGISGTPTVSSISGSVLTLSTAQTLSSSTVLSFSFPNDAAAEAVLSEADYAQYLNQKASRDYNKAAGIERIEVTAGGSGYDAADNFTVTITGDGTGATVVDAGVTVSGGAISSIVLNDKGTDYTVADIVISSDGSGQDATARAVIAPRNGHGVDPVKELGAFFVALNTQLDGSVNGDITVGNDFRQVMLLKEPREYNATPDGGKVATADSLKALGYLDVTGSIASFQVDEVITGGTSGAKAFIAEKDAGTGFMYYYQNAKTGYGTFVNNETITGGTSNATTQTESANGVNPPEVEKQSGTVLFLENRTPIDRTATQIEDIKLILEF